jgi:ribose transport system ATP-binding protein
MAFIVFNGIGKDYGSVSVLEDVSLSIEGGEVHALIGENGAGKSTLMKILTGFVTPSSGQVTMDGRALHFRNNREAEAAGLVLIHQEFNLVEDLSITDNLFLGRELRRGGLLDTNAMHRQALRALEQVGLNLDPRTKIRDLIVPHKQMVEIARALSRNARVLVMDEPTATLTPSETKTLFEIISRLRQGGVTIIYISHKLDEVKQISDHVTVLRDGRLITTRATASLTQGEMANLMVGRELEDMYPPKSDVHSLEVVLEVRHLSVPGWAHDISFELRRGEVLGFAGLVGAGRTELFEGLIGLRPHSSGTLRVNGKPLGIGSPQDSLRTGIVYLSEDRKGKGLLVDFQMRPNLTLSALQLYAKPLLDANAEHRALQHAVDEFGIRAGRLDARAGSLSGGNQQKLALAKVLHTLPQIVILDEPTRGVDIGAKREIYFFIKQLSNAGKSVIVISSELPELLGLAHRLIVLRQGIITGVLEGQDLNETEVIQYATGVKQRPRITA